jgi:N utilization substance protein A
VGFRSHFFIVKENIREKPEGAESEMKSDFLIAITQLSAEKNLPQDVVLSAVETALASAYRKDIFSANRSISVKIDPNTGRVKVLAEKDVVEKVTAPRREISLADARRLNPEVQIGDGIEVEDTPTNAGRIAAQTAKQVILQRLHEAEHSAIFEEYAHKEGDIVSGVVQRIEPKQIIVDLGRAEAVLPLTEQVRGDRYRIGQRLRFYLLEVLRLPKGPQLIVSRSHRDLARRLFELEVSEVYNGVVEIKAVAREAGYRTKVAVAARQEGVDPVGCCVGLRGIRIQNIINELGGEKIDVVLWDSSPATLIANALSPAKVLSVKLDQEAEVATVVVPDKQLSLAIGKEGQNARLAAKLTGWRIDIKSATTAEVEKAPETAPVAEEVGVVEDSAVTEVSAEPVLPEIEEIEEIIPIEEPAAEVTAETAEAEPVSETEETAEEEEEEEYATLEIPYEPVMPVESGGLRFAEDILPMGTGRGGGRKKKKKKTRGRNDTEIDLKAGKARRTTTFFTEEED